MQEMLSLWTLRHLGRGWQPDGPQPPATPQGWKHREARASADMVRGPAKVACGLVPGHSDWGDPELTGGGL